MINQIAKKPLKKRIARFFIDRKFYVILILIIGGTFLWAKIKMNIIEKENLKVKRQLIENYQMTIDSLNIANIEMTMKVFTWAIRSELLRENIEQVNQFFISLIQEPSIVNLKIVNPDNFQIIISTDKKEEGQLYNHLDLINTDDISISKDSIFIKVVNPIMGLNKKLGILVAEIRPVVNNLNE